MGNHFHYDCLIMNLISKRAVEVEEGDVLLIQGNGEKVVLSTFTSELNGVWIVFNDYTASMHFRNDEIVQIMKG